MINLLQLNIVQKLHAKRVCDEWILFTFACLWILTKQLLVSKIRNITASVKDFSPVLRIVNEKVVRWCDVFLHTAIVVNLSLAAHCSNNRGN